MKVYTEEEMNKVWKSFVKYLRDQNVPTCDLAVEIYQPSPIEVELIAKVKE